jgi:PAS domain S-box-containing protein
MLPGIKTYAYPPEAAGQSLAGTFYLDVATGRIEWSEELFQIHGYSPGEVVPTFDLLLAHKHPQDREHIRRIFADLCSRGGRQTMFHRVIDSRGRQHQVLTVAEACEDSGRITGMRGVTVDLSRAVESANRNAADEAIRGTYASREAIEQAKGIIMGLRGGTPEQAFSILAVRSQNSNIKLATLAAQLVEAAGQGKAREVLGGWQARMRQLDRTL